LGQDLLKLGKQGEAVQHWKVALEADPNDATALYNLARILSKSDDPEAKIFVARLHELEQKQELKDRVQQENNLALQSAQEHNWPQAVSQLKEAIGLCDQCLQLSVLHRNLGLIYAQFGEVENGKQELSLALKLNPKDDDAVKALQILNKIQTPPGVSN
jgi:tetratricopeptide (TPR) repeat protein